MSNQPHQFWQTFAAPGTYQIDPPEGFTSAYPAELSDGRQLLLPIRVLPGDGTRAVASLILNQASFVVEDVIAEQLCGLLTPLAPELVVGVPTLGLGLASNVARRLGHGRMLALGTSRKFWYDEALSVPLRSITSPGAGKTLFVDPRMLPILSGKRVVVIDDVISTGQSMAAALGLLGKAGVQPAAIACAMLQGNQWGEHLAEAPQILAPLASPRLALTETGTWKSFASEASA